VPFGAVEHACAEFLRLGEHVEVVEPPELREAVTRSVRALAARYAV
jgi:predicted DNA-binding transcriptional regulator YafY